MDENRLSHMIIGAAIEVHRVLGPGLLESVYEDALCYELRNLSLVVENQLYFPIIYKNKELERRFVIDILVNRKVIVELKSVRTVEDVHHKQLLSYLRLTGKKLGLLINFNESLLKDGIHRLVNNLSIIK